MRHTGTYAISTTLGEAVQAFVPHRLPPENPALDPAAWSANHRAELALARLSGVSGLVPSVDWLIYSAIRKEALLTSLIEGTQATLTDLFDDEAGLVVKRVLRKYKYPPDQAEEAVELVLQQVESLGESWV